MVAHADKAVPVGVGRPGDGDEVGDGRVVFRYEGGAPNGAQNDIAGITSEAGNVVGLMPHPEHAVDPLLGAIDGQGLFRSAQQWIARAAQGQGVPA